MYKPRRYMSLVVDSEPEAGLVAITNSITNGPVAKPRTFFFSFSFFFSPFVQIVLVVVFRLVGVNFFS